MIKVTVIGAAGRMGRRLVCQICQSSDLSLAGALEIDGSPFIGQDAGELAGCGKAQIAVTPASAGLPAGTEAVIIFSTVSVIEVAREAARIGASVVIGTTALSSEVLDELKALAASGARIVQSGNMSVGVNLLVNLVRQATRVLGPDSDVEIVEMHHNQKKDAPSGTAAMLAKAVCEVRDWNDRDLVYGREGVVGARPRREIGMHSLRGGDVVGDHTVVFALNGERIELTHRASSRDTFARGALQAVRFLAAAPAGFYDMQQVLGLSSQD